MENIVYVGNDINDIESMGAVGCSVAVADGQPDVKEGATIVLNSKGTAPAARTASLTRLPNDCR